MMMRKGLMAAALVIVAGMAGSAPAVDFTWPISARVSSTWYNVRSYGYHRGLDLAAPAWRAVGAARAGRVTFRGWSGGYGKLVVMGHDGGYSTYYAHNYGYGYGGYVGRNTTISYCGSTGNSTGPHVHFEIRRWGSKYYIPGAYGSYKYRGYAIPYNYAGIY